MELPILPTKDEQVIRPMAYECKFTVESRSEVGGRSHLRMLTPEELKLAQGFPRRYVIDRYEDGRPVPKSEQVAKIGNSVVPLMARLIVSANVRQEVSA